MTTGTPSSRVRFVVSQQKYYEGLSGDLSDRYLRVKNSNKNTSGYGVFLAVLAISGRFQRVLVLPLTAYNISFMKQRFSPVSLSADITNLCFWS